VLTRKHARRLAASTARLLARLLARRIVVENTKKLERLLIREKRAGPVVVAADLLQ
jgi:hypothetical protein